MNRDGIVEIDTVLNDRQFNAQYYEIEDKLNGLVEEYRIQHPEEDFSLPVGFVAMTINDAKRMAIAFAEAVS